MNDKLAEKYKESQRQMREALEAVEWVPTAIPSEHYCPWCREYQVYGHNPECQRQAALGIKTEVAR